MEIPEDSAEDAGLDDAGEGDSPQKSKWEVGCLTGEDY